MSVCVALFGTSHTAHTQHMTYTLSDKCLTLYVQFQAPDDGQKTV